MGNLGNPGFVLGSDVSMDMVKYSQRKYNLDSLDLVQLDVTDGREFGREHCERFDVVTSFSCLHWVSDHPAASRLTHQVLKKGGKFLFLV